MKKVFAKMSFSALLLLGMMMFASNMQAQTSTLQPPPGPDDIKTFTGTWVSAPSAIQLLEGELNGSIQQALATLPSGGQQYIVWKYKAMLYEGVRATLIDGGSVPKAIRNNYDRLAGAPHMEPTITALSHAEWQAMYDELIALLSN